MYVYTNIITRTSVCVTNDILVQILQNKNKNNTYSNMNIDILLPILVRLF